MKKDGIPPCLTHSLSFSGYSARPQGRVAEGSRKGSTPAPHHEHDVARQDGFRLSGFANRA